MQIQLYNFACISVYVINEGHFIQKVYALY